MSRFTAGMKAGAKPFEKVAQESASAIRDTKNAVMKDVDALRRSINNIVDVIAEDDPQNREDILAALKEGKAHKRPACYKIQIIYNKAYAEVAEQLRESLNRQGNAASVQTYEDYKVHNVVADYYIMLGYSVEKTDELEAKLDAVGCHIDTCGRYIYVHKELFGDAIDGLTDEEWQKFIDYYRASTNQAAASNEHLQKADKYRQRKQKRRGKRDRAADGILNAGNKAIEFQGDLSERIGIAGWLLIPSMFATFLLMALLAVPTGLTEALFYTTLNALESRDTKGIEEAQKQILLAKTCTYIKELQLADAV